MSSSPLTLRCTMAGLLTAFGTIAAVAQTPLAVSHVPVLVSSGQARLVSVLEPSRTLHLAISLPLRNQAALEAQLADLYNPQSPNFHHWLSQPEFEALYGAEPARFTALVQWARTNGMTVTYQSSNGRVIEVDAPVSAVNRAFHVTENTYHDGELKRDFHAPDREPTTDLPFELLSVDNLDDAAPKHNQLKKRPASLPINIAAPNPLLSGVSSELIGADGLVATHSTIAPKPHVSGSGPDSMYLPSDMRAAYYGAGNLTGAGQVVGIFSFDGYLTPDLAVYTLNTGVTNTVPVTNVLTGGFSGGCILYNPCDDGEQILDIEQVEGMAPGLTQILFYEGTNATTELNQMATDNIAKTITSSWGGGNFGAASDTYFMQMATQGQTYMNATGDDGGFNSSTYSAPSLDANIVQVGGTELVTSGPGGAWASEAAWDDSGGGFYVTGMRTSSKILIPTWQKTAGVINASNKGSTTYRNAPDMAAEADFDNPTVSNGVFSPGYGGTSYATPRMAGYIALANQQAVANGLSTVGFIDPTLYTGGLSSSAATIYHDIISGSAPSSAGSPIETYPAVAGYDDVTGWGSPNGAGLINYLAGAPVPDFALAPVGFALVNNTSGTASVPLTAYNNFSGNVTLSATGLPNGVTAAFNSGSPSSPPTILFTAAGATMATYNVAVTGTSGNETHSAVLPLTINKRVAADFTISATAAVVLVGGGGSSSVTVTAGSGLAGSIMLSLGALPPGVTASLSSTTTPLFTTVPTVITLTLTAAAAATPNSYSINVTGTSANGIVHTVAVPVTLSLPTSLIVNGGFETGAAAPWTFTTQSGTSAITLLTTASGIPPHTGNYFTLLEGGAAAGVDVMSQQVSISSGSKATLSLWYWFLTAETGTTAVDTMTIQLTDTSGNVLTTLATLSNLNGAGYWSNLSYDVSPYLGQTVNVVITAKQAGKTSTDFLIDDVSLFVQ